MMGRLCFEKAGSLHPSAPLEISEVGNGFAMEVANWSPLEFASVLAGLPCVKENSRARLMLKGRRLVSSENGWNTHINENVHKHECKSSDNRNEIGARDNFVSFTEALGLIFAGWKKTTWSQAADKVQRNEAQFKRFSVRARLWHHQGLFLRLRRVTSCKLMESWWKLCKETLNWRKFNKAVTWTCKKLLKQ